MTELTHQEKLSRLSALCCVIFKSTDNGRELLRMLKDMYILNTPVADMRQGEHWPYFREGQNSLIRQLEEWANKED